MYLHSKPPFAGGGCPEGRKQGLWLSGILGNPSTSSNWVKRESKSAENTLLAGKGPLTPTECIHASIQAFAEELRESIRSGLPGMIAELPEGQTAPPPPPPPKRTSLQTAPGGLALMAPQPPPPKRPTPETVPWHGGGRRSEAREGGCSHIERIYSVVPVVVALIIGSVTGLLLSIQSCHSLNMRYALFRSW